MARYSCSHCGTKTNKARPVQGHILCNPCNLALIKTGNLPVLDYFERQRQVREHAAQSGWDFVIGNPAY